MKLGGSHGKILKKKQVIKTRVKFTLFVPFKLLKMDQQFKTYRILTLKSRNATLSLHVKG
jgi:hypothetical protein